MDHAVYGKTMENLRNRINIKLASNKNEYLKWTPKLSYMSQKIFDNGLVAIRKNKVTLTLKKSAYIGMCILQLSEVLMHQFHYEYNPIGVMIEEFVELKPKMCLHLVEDNSEPKKAKGVNRNIVATISHNEHKDVLLNKKCLRHSMNMVQSKDHKTGTYKINKISLSCFDDKICIQKLDVMDQLLVTRVNYKKQLS